MINVFCIRPRGFNIGNAVIYQGTLALLHEAFNGLVNVISLPATSRYESQAKAGLSAQTVYEINQYGHGVIVGGGNLYENGELEVNLTALQVLEVPLFLFSLSRGRRYNREGELVPRTDAMPASLIQALHQKASLSLARDRATAAYLHQIGCSAARVGGCPSLCIDRLVHRLPAAGVAPLGALISVRNPMLMSLPLRWQFQVRDDIAGLIALLRREGYGEVRLLCHDHRDIPFAASFDAPYLYTDDVFTYLSLLRSCAVNVSYRLHATIPCLVFGVPVINISYDERAFSLLETIGFAPWDVPMLAGAELLATVASRCRQLERLGQLRQELEADWRALTTTMTEAFASFAIAVRAYADRVSRPQGPALRTGPAAAEVPR